MATERNPAIVAGLRILAGVGIYFVLVGLWLTSGLDKLYDRFVLWAAKLVVPAFTHFPVGSSEGVDMLDVHDQAFVLVWILAMALVVKGVAWRDRPLRYGTVVVAVVVLHIVGLALQLYLALCLKAEQSLGVALLLPWELQLVKLATQAFFLGGLQVAAFVTLVLTAFWSTERGLGELFGTEERASEATAEPRRKLPRGVALAVPTVAGVLLVAVAAGAWWVRERDPRHVAAHSRVGNAFANQQLLDQAEGQYRAAIRGGAQDGPTWLALAIVVNRQGDGEEAARVVDRALEVVTDTEWRLRLEQAQVDLGNQ